MTVVQRMQCPNCGRGFDCDGSAGCWCLKVDRNFDYEDMIIRTGAAGCVCPVCLTGRTGAVAEEIPAHQRSADNT